MKKNPANIKVEILSDFLLSFNKLIPTKVLQSPKHIKINGKQSLGFELLAIKFNDKIGNIIAKTKLII